MPIQKQRSQDIDVLRCFGITLMVTGHIYIGELFDIFIHAFHMPMFFIISGMFFRIKADMTLYTFMITKVKALLIPYFLFGLLYYLIWPSYQSIFTNSDLFLQMLNGIFLDNTQALSNWFLTALFLSNVIYFILLQFLGDQYFLHIIVAITALLGCCLRELLPFHLPWALDSALVGVGLMHIGCLLYQSDKPLIKRLLHMKLPDILIAGAFVTALIFVNGYVNMRQGIYQNIPLFWFNSILATLCGLGIAQYTVKWAPKWAVSFLADIGRNSIVFVCLNQLILMLVDKPLNLVDLPASRLVLLILSMLIMYAIAKVLSHPRLKFLIGR